jgi:hypothetical protein
MNANDLVVPKNDPTFGIPQKQLRELRSKSSGLGEHTLTHRRDVVHVLGRSVLLHRHGSQGRMTV